VENQKQTAPFIDQDTCRYEVKDTNLCTLQSLVVDNRHTKRKDSSFFLTSTTLEAHGLAAGSTKSFCKSSST